MDSLLQDDEYTNYYASLMLQMQQSASGSPASSENSGEHPSSGDGSPASDDLEKQYTHHTGLSPAESNGDYLYEAMGTQKVSYDADDDDADDDSEEEGMDELPHHRLMISSPTAAAVATTAKKRKKKAKRDPNKPKGFLPAILLYSNANRPRVKEENPESTFGDVAKLLSAEYNALSPEEVAFWQQKAADDKERYNREMLSYVPPPPSPPVAQVVSGGANANDSDESGSEEEDTMVVQQAAAPKAKKAKKDPNAPKQNRSAWQFFSSGNARKIIKSRNPEAGPNDVSRILGQHWRALSETERAPLKAMANADKLRFKREMEAYQLTKANNDQEDE